MTATTAIEVPTRTRTRSADTGARAVRGAALVGAAVLAVFFVGPLLWVIWGSVSTGQTVSFDNYQRLIDYGAGMWRYIGNTLVVVLITIVGSLVVSILAGYAFARMRFRGSKALFVGILAILMVPHTSLLIPLYIWLDRLSLGNSLVGVGLVMIMYQMPFSIFMMRNSFESVPTELDEAALVDGCSRVGALFRVVLPAVVPGLVTVGLFAFLAAWNEFVTALILISDSTKFPLPLALVNLIQGDWGAIDYGALQAGVTVSALPCIVLFFFLQRAFVSGFTNGAVKG